MCTRRWVGTLFFSNTRVSKKECFGSRCEAVLKENGVSKCQVPGFYPCGQKQFRVNFSQEEVKNRRSKSDCSGVLSWSVEVSKINENGEFSVALCCSLDFLEWDVLAWTVSTDLIARCLHLDNPDRNVARRGRWTFSRDDNIWRRTFNRISEEFWKNGNLSVEIEIGIKSMSENIQKPLTELRKMFFIRNAGRVYYSTVSTILREAPEIYRYRFYETTKSNVAFVFWAFENSDVFRVFMDIIHGKSPSIQSEHAHELLRLGYKYGATRVTTECKKYLMENTVDVEETIRLADKYWCSSIVDHYIEKITDLEVLNELLQEYRTLKKPTVEKLIEQFTKIA